MKPVSLIFLLGGMFACWDALCIDFPSARPSSSNENVDVPTGVVDFPKPKTNDDFPSVVDFPQATEENIVLTSTEFPKTIQDLSFKSRMELLADGYEPYETVYKNGVCVSGCAYPGITIQEDMDAVEEATEEMADLIEQEEKERQEKKEKKHKKDKKRKQEDRPQATDWCHNGLSTRLPLRYPVDMSNLKYKLSSDFGFRTKSENDERFHPAIDISCPVGTPVYATADGVVEIVKTDNSNAGAGLYINIKHDNGLITRYLHLDKAMVEKNQRVSACQQIATSGKSGYNINGNPYTGAHLDYRIRFESNKNKYVDILCPCRASTTAGHGQSSNYDMSCTNSLFNAPYQFKNASSKFSNWRIEHGHCMKKKTDLLPDEVAP